VSLYVFLACSASTYIEVILHIIIIIIIIIIIVVVVVIGAIIIIIIVIIKGYSSLKSLLL
jgi:hypothetical protein